MTPEQFEAEKQRILGRAAEAPKVAWYKRRSFRLTIFVLGVTYIGYNFLIKSEGLPKCGSSTAITTLKKAIDQSQFARSEHLTAIDIEGVKEAAFDEAKKHRACQATVTFNNTEKAPVDYRIDGRPNGNFMLEFRLKE